MSTTPMSEGKIVQCIGAVIDIQFPREAMPNIYDALTLVEEANSFAEKGLTFEVEQQLGDGVVRTIALGSSDGLRRGMKVKNTGAPISVPVGPATLGRVMDVLGRPDRRTRSREGRRAPLDPRVRAQVRRALAFRGAARDGHQGDRPGGSVRQGRQGRPLRRRRRRQDRDDARAHQQHRDAALGPVGVRRRGRAHSRGQRLLPRDERRQGHRAGRPVEVESGDGVRPDERAAGQPPAGGADGPHHGRKFPRRGPRHPALHRQHLPLHARGHGSVGAAGPHAFGGGIPAHARRGDGPPAGAHHVHQEGLDHFDPSRLRSCRRLDGSVARHDFRPPRRNRRAVARYRGARHLPVGGPARFDFPPGRPERRWRGALQHDARRAGGAAALQGAARHHRDPGHGRAFARGQACRGPCAQDPALPLATFLRSPGLHGLARQVRDASRTRSRAST